MLVKVTKPGNIGFAQGGDMFQLMWLPYSDNLVAAHKKLAAKQVADMPYSEIWGFRCFMRMRVIHVRRIYAYAVNVVDWLYAHDVVLGNS
jgi:hypothetical protein